MLAWCKHFCLQCLFGSVFPRPGGALPPSVAHDPSVMIQNYSHASTTIAATTQTLRSKPTPGKVASKVGSACINLSLRLFSVSQFNCQFNSQSVSEIATDRYVNMQKKCKPAKGLASQYWTLIIQHWLFCGQLILYFPSRVINCTTKLEPEVVPSDARNMQ